MKTRMVQGIYPIGGAIGGGIIDHKNLKVTPRLVLYAFNATQERCTAIARGDDDTYAGQNRNGFFRSHGMFSVVFDNALESGDGHGQRRGRKERAQRAK